MPGGPPPHSCEGGRRPQNQRRHERATVARLVSLGSLNDRHGRVDGMSRVAGPLCEIAATLHEAVPESGRRSPS